MSNRAEIEGIISDLEKAAVAANFKVFVYGKVAGYRLLGFVRRASEHNESPRRIYLSAGIHGDEPAGPLALLELLRSDALPRHHEFTICPLMNPTGFEAGIRENAAGVDLNRDYTGFTTSEIAEHRDWLHENLSRPDLSVHLHEDWEARGFYLYELNFSQQESFAASILRAVAPFLPIESAEVIDGRPAKDGVIRPATIPDLPEGMPESIHLQHWFGGGLNYTIETASAFEIERRVASLKAAILAVV